MGYAATQDHDVLLLAHFRLSNRLSQVVVLLAMGNPGVLYELMLEPPAYLVFPDFRRLLNRVQKLLHDRGLFNAQLSLDVFLQIDASDRDARRRAEVNAK